MEETGREAVRVVLEDWLRAELGWPRDAAGESSCDLADFVFDALNCPPEIQDMKIGNWVSLWDYIDEQSHDEKGDN